MNTLTRTSDLWKKYVPPKNINYYEGWTEGSYNKAI